MALRYHLATYDPVTFLVGDEIVSGTPTFVHADTIYAKCSDGYYHSFGVNKRVVKDGRYVDEDTVYADNGSDILLDPMPMVVWQDAGANEEDYSDLSDWSLTNNCTRTLEVTSLTGAANSVYSFTDASSTEAGHVANVGGWATNEVGVIKLIVEKDGVGGHCFDLSGFSIDWTKQIQVACSPYNGTYDDKITAQDIKVIDDGNWYIYLVEVGAGDAIAKLRFYPARYNGDDPTVSEELSSTGTTKFVHIEFHKDKTIAEVESLGPIFTSGAVGSTGAITNTYPAANWSNSEGPIHLVHDYKGIDEVILLNDDVAILYVTSDVLYLDDGTNTTSIAYATEGEHEIGIALDETNGFMRLNVDGAWAD